MRRKENVTFYVVNEILVVSLIWPTSVAVKDGGRKVGGCGGEVEEPAAGAGGDDQQHPDVSAAGN